MATNYDVVYILREGENEELRYSLRTLVNLPHGKVVFVGGKPEGIEPDLWIPTLQDKGKWANSGNSIRTVCEDDRISDNFYLFNDDFFVMKPIRTLPIYRNHNLTRFALMISKNGRRYSEYVEDRINPTIQELRKRRMTIWNFEVHVPMLINRNKMLKICEEFPALAKRSCYGNYYHLQGIDIDPRGMNDGSVQSPKAEFNPDRIFISTTDESWQGVVGKQIKKLFPNPSKYELKKS